MSHLPFSSSLPAFAARRLCETGSRSIDDLRFERECIADAMRSAAPTPHAGAPSGSR